MKQKCYWAFGLALLALAGLPARGNGQSLRHSLTKYDRIADTTTMECELFNNEATSNFSVTAFATFRGKTAGETLRCWLALSTSQGKATRKTPSRFQTATALALRLEEAELAIPLKNYRRDYYEMIQRLGESADADLTQHEWQKLLAAKQLSGQWGATEFTLSEKALATLKEFLRRYVTPDTIEPGKGQND